VGTVDHNKEVIKMTDIRRSTKALAILLALVVGLAFSVPLLGDSDVYAAGKAKTVTVKFNANGGKIGKVKAKTIKVVKGKKIGKLPKSPKRVGYSFKGWYTKKSGGKKVTKNTRPKKAATYYARWAVKSYTLTFDANGGTVTEKSRKVKYKAKFGTLPTATRTGYKFKGWYEAKTGDDVVKPDETMPPANDVVYAQWAAAAPQPTPSEPTYKLTIVHGGIDTWDILRPGTVINVGSGNYKAGERVWIEIIHPFAAEDGWSFLWESTQGDGVEIIPLSSLGSEFRVNFSPGERTGTYLIMPAQEVKLNGYFYSE
jgi:uncharacterized repeat protein (TIGR02543 family)